MDITWLGHSCFLIRSSHSRILTDPYSPSLGYSIGKPSVNIVTISHEHPDHSGIEGVGGQPRVVSGPGEYEIGDVFITGIASFHDAEKGKLRGKNTIYLIETDDLALCHLGDLGHVLTASQVEDIGKVDILFLPVGGGATIDGTKAAEVVRQIEPKVVVPMHYKTPAVHRELDSVDRFLKEMGVRDVIPQPKLTFTKNSLPLTTQVFLCDYKT